MAWAQSKVGIGNQAIQVYRATGAADIAEALAPGVDFELLEVRLHLSAAGGAAQAFTTTLDGGVTDDVYDFLIDSQDMNTVTDHSWQGANSSMIFGEDDVIDFAWTNTNTRTWGLEVFIRIL
jgi:hypothetical protein